MLLQATVDDLLHEFIHECNHAAMPSVIQCIDSFSHPWLNFIILPGIMCSVRGFSVMLHVACEAASCCRLHARLLCIMCIHGPCCMQISYASCTCILHVACKSVTHHEHACCMLHTRLWYIMRKHATYCMQGSDAAFRIQDRDALCAWQVLCCPHFEFASRALCLLSLPCICVPHVPALGLFYSWLSLYLGDLHMTIYPHVLSVSWFQWSSIATCWIVYYPWPLSHYCFVRPLF
jgi:hypothetical protein